jgi:hypothetical protein
VSVAVVAEAAKGKVRPTGTLSTADRQKYADQNVTAPVALPKTTTPARRRTHTA